MNRFVAIVWNALVDETSRDAAAIVAELLKHKPDWLQRWNRAGIVVFEAPRRSIAEEGLELGDGALFVGAVFQGVRRARAADLDCDALVKSRAANACTQLWGRYVLFVRDAPNACVYVLRDPSGALPCYIAQRGRAFVFFSHPADIDALALPSSAIDWTYLALRLANNRVITSRTGIESVRMLAPGEVACVGQGRRRQHVAWSVHAYATAAAETAAADRLRRSVSMACSAWADCFDRLGMRLSGGLDSAIVLGSLPRGRVQALNLVTPTLEGDERTYARAAAAHCGAPLTEAYRDPCKVDLESAVSHAPALNPYLWLADGETDDIDALFVRESGVKAMVSGRGGDNVFYRTLNPHVLADWVKARGFGLKFLRQCLAYAAATGRPPSRAVFEAIGLLRRRKVGPTTGETDLLSPRARDMTELAPAPEMADLPPGKRLHIMMIEDRLNYFDYRPHADYIYPLVSQPVIEATLGLPTYVLAPGGSDRGLARQAFAAQVPTEILQRRSKGQTGAYLTMILLRHRKFLNDFLLNGALADARMLDLPALKYALSEEGLMRKPQLMARIVGLLSIEAWLRRPPTMVRAANP